MTYLHNSIPISIWQSTRVLLREFNCNYFCWVFNKEIIFNFEVKWCHKKMLLVKFQRYWSLKAVMLALNKLLVQSLTITHVSNQWIRLFRRYRSLNAWTYKYNSKSATLTSRTKAKIWVVLYITIDQYIPPGQGKLNVIKVLDNMAGFLKLKLKSIFWAEVRKNIRIFYLKIFLFWL